MKTKQNRISYQKINNIIPPNISQIITDRFLYLFNEIDKMYEAKGLKTKERKSFKFF